MRLRFPWLKVGVETFGAMRLTSVSYAEITACCLLCGELDAQTVRFYKKRRYLDALNVIALGLYKQVFETVFYGRNVMRHVEENIFGDFEQC